GRKLKMSVSAHDCLTRPRHSHLFALSLHVNTSRAKADYSSTDLGEVQRGSRLPHRGTKNPMFSTQMNPIDNSVAPATLGAAPPVRVRPAPILGQAGTD